MVLKLIRHISFCTQAVIRSSELSPTLKVKLKRTGFADMIKKDKEAEEKKEKAKVARKKKLKEKKAKEIEDKIIEDIAEGLLKGRRYDHYRRLYRTNWWINTDDG